MELGISSYEKIDPNRNSSMHTTVKALLALTGVAIMGAACSSRQADSLDPDAAGDRLGSQRGAGTWVNPATGPVPLYRESMTLAQSGDGASGTGTYAMEAGRVGPTTIDGT